MTTDYERGIAARDHDLDHLARAIAHELGVHFVVRLSEMWYIGYQEHGSSGIVGLARAMRFTDRAAADVVCAMKIASWSKATVEETPAVRLCEECHAHPIDDGYHSAKDDASRERLCVSCFWWTQKLEYADDPSSLRVNGRHYWIGPEHIDEPGAARKHQRGSYGDPYTIVLTDGRTVRTTNLWTQGDVPAHFRDRLPDNARFEGAGPHG